MNEMIFLSYPALFPIFSFLFFLFLFFFSAAGALFKEKEKEEKRNKNIGKRELKRAGQGEQDKNNSFFPFPFGQRSQKEERNIFISSPLGPLREGKENVERASASGKGLRKKLFSASFPLASSSNIFLSFIPFPPTKAKEKRSRDVARVIKNYFFSFGGQLAQRKRKG